MRVSLIILFRFLLLAANMSERLKNTSTPDKRIAIWNEALNALGNSQQSVERVLKRVLKSVMKVAGLAGGKIKRVNKKRQSPYIEL